MLSKSESMLRRVLPAISCIMLAACDSNQVQLCEKQLKEKLVAPASYKRVSVNEFVNPSYKQPYHEVTITYDAVNSYNAPLRGKESCWYKPDTSESIDPFGFNSIGAVDMNATDMNATDMNATDMNASEADLNKVADQAVGDADNAMSAAGEEAAHGSIDSEGARALAKSIDDRRAKGEISDGVTNDTYPTNDAGD